MKRPDKYHIVHVLPLISAAIATACGANDEPRSTEPEFNRVATENGEGTAPGTSGGQGARDESPDAEDGAEAEDDSDGDRLPDSVETQTNVYVSPTNTGTDPRNWDSDGDGLADGDEVLGTTGGLDLPALGTNPLRKNILIEYDWFDDANDDCGAHSHRPTPAAVALVARPFAQSPIPNPDGSTGITVIQDYGQGGVFSGGNWIADSDGVIVGGVSAPDFRNYRAQNFAANREGYFHYTLMPHRYNVNDGSSGQAEVIGDDLIVSLYCFFSNDHYVASTIVHELGHNLGLMHGGNVPMNNKPNYNSVMNYDYQFAGVDTNCTPPGDGVIDYSHNQRIPLNEHALDEREGICGASPWDWNANGVIEPLVSQDVNRDSSLQTLLEDHDDWAAVVYDWDRQPNRATEIVTCQTPPAL